MINVLRLILFQKESYFNYLKKRQLISTLVLLAIKRTKNSWFCSGLSQNIWTEKTRKEVLDPAEDFVGTLGGGS